MANKKKILTSGFQHGISKEISKDISCIRTMYETNIVQLYFVYNNSVMPELLNNKFNMSENIVVGLPADMRKSISKENFRKKKGFLYATTNVYCGNRGIPSRSGSTDYNKSKFEFELIQKVQHSYFNST